MSGFILQDSNPGTIREGLPKRVGFWLSSSYRFWQPCRMSKGSQTRVCCCFCHTRALLQRFSCRKRAEIPIYSFAKHQRQEETTSIYSPHVLILEGIFALYDKRVLDMLDMRVGFLRKFVSTVTDALDILWSRCRYLLVKKKSVNLHHLFVTKPIH